MSCLDPPLEFLPQSDWYCKSCLEKHDDLDFDRDSQPIIYPVDFRSLQKRRKRGRRRREETRESGRRRGRRRGSRQDNPLEGLSERIENFREQSRLTRSERAENRRKRVEERGEGEGNRRVKYRANDYEIEEDIDYEFEGVVRRMVMGEEEDEVFDEVVRERSRNREKEERRGIGNLVG